MAATYSSFMTTKYYSPVFNTALFDGPIRIYFSQSYESSALKFYHLLQNQHPEIWAKLKACQLRTKTCAFVLIYPEAKDLEIIFNEKDKKVCTEVWAEGVAIGCSQPVDDGDFEDQLDLILISLSRWLDRQIFEDLSA